MTYDKLENGDEFAENTFFLGWTNISRGVDAVECLKCGGYAEGAESSTDEIDSELNCGRSWACCCAAFICKKCGARMVGQRLAPEME